MSLRVFVLTLVSMVFPLFSLAQLDHPAVVIQDVPDFGAVSGTWGHLQFYRPFGFKAVVLDEWQDLATSYLINGEPLNTDRQGWLPLLDQRTLWSQLHPALTTEADTTAPSLLVNYRQGDADFKDFTVWYHNSLGKATRYAWNSKLRSHQRFIGVQLYDEQRHQLQIENRIDDQVIKVELGYDHQVNPLYLYELDTVLQAWNYNDKLQLRSDRWSGNLHWQNIDSNSVGSEFFAWVQGGIWEWPAAQRHSLSTLAYFGHRFQVREWSPVEMKIGVIRKQLGGDGSIRHFMEVNLPQFSNRHLSVELGLKNLGQWRFLPNVKAGLDYKPLNITYQTHQLIDERTFKPELTATTVHELTSTLKFAAFEISMGGWQGQNDQGSIRGTQGYTRLTFPWEMELKLGGSMVDQATDWIWAKKQVLWELNQDAFLFDQAMHVHLNVWGRHLFQPQQGFLDPDDLVVRPTDIDSDETILHLLNYSIQAQVSTLIIGFTDTNMLHDPLWSQYVSGLPNSEYTIMANQFTESRFRYISLIWVFDN
ncbi:MAG: hypothetical protein U9Q77_05815 [Candidatus Marinimicrobia bacterium]|nr:hypothetical protein [Candidatus Neomarinimicrobiota bacterium]